MGVKQPTVWAWNKKGTPPPIIRCVQIEKLTGGAVNRKDLRPDDWHLIWPELAGDQPK
ncbi:helix-turn-helix domain-containing protein [Neisseria gonorrhoeae]